MTKIHIPVAEEWNHMFRARRSFRSSTAAMDDVVTYSEPYSSECGESVWFYSWGNARWLRCPIGRLGDRLNDAGDRISAVNVELVDGRWTFVVSVDERRHRS